MSFLLIGDQHLGGGVSLGRVAIGSAQNSRVSDRFALLEWSLQQAIDNDIKIIILTGDAFEHPSPSSSLLALFVGWLKQCEANNITVYIVLGNHDLLRTGNYYSSALDVISECDLNNVFVIRDMTTIFLESIAITFMPFRDRKSFNVETNSEAISLLKNTLSYELASIPLTYKKIVIGHLALEGSIPGSDEIDDLTNELFCPLEMFNGYDYVWMGHIHKYQVLQKNNPHIAHTGSMDISNFGEADHKKRLILFDIEAEEEVRTLILPTRPLHKIVISVPQETKETTQYVINEIAANYPDLNKAIIRLEVHLDTAELLSINRGEIEQFLYSCGVFNVSSISESKKLAPVKKDGTTSDINTTIDARSAIKVWAASQIDEKDKERFIAVALTIFNEHMTE